MRIGNRIKELRKERGITQEQLAKSIGISFQAVSKWENNIALPDITLAPVLASYFGITMDELFDFRLKEIEDAVEAIADRAYPYRETDPEKAREILTEGLRQYPDNELLLNHLLYVMNYTKDPDETIDVAGALAAKTADAEIRYDALRFLAYAYKAKGDIKSAEAAIEQIPEIYFTKLTEIAFLLDGEPKLQAALKQKWVSFENMIQMMCKIAECYEARGELTRAVEELEAALRLMALMKNESFDVYVSYYTKLIAKWKNAL